MGLNSLFTTAIYILVSVLLIFSIKVYKDTLTINKKGEFEYSKLLNNFDLESKKHKTNQQKILLVDDLYESLFIRLFKIAKDLLSLQKLIFEKRVD